MKKLLIIAIAILMGITVCSAALRIATYDVENGRLNATQINYSEGSTSRVLSCVSANLILSTGAGNSVIVTETAHDTDGNTFEVVGAGTLSSYSAQVNTVQASGAPVGQTASAYTAKFAWDNRTTSLIGYDTYFSYNGDKISSRGLNFIHDSAVGSSRTSYGAVCDIGSTTAAEIDGAACGFYTTIRAATGSGGAIRGTYTKLTSAGAADATGSKIMITGSGTGDVTGCAISVSGSQQNTISGSDISVVSSATTSAATGVRLSVTHSASDSRAGLTGLDISTSYAGNDTLVSGSTAVSGIKVSDSYTWIGSGSSTKLNCGVMVDTTLASSTSIDYYSLYLKHDNVYGATDSGVGQGFLYGVIDSYIPGGSGKFTGIYLDMDAMSSTTGQNLNGMVMECPSNFKFDGIELTSNYDYHSPSNITNRGIYFNTKFRKAVDMGAVKYANSITVQHYMESGAGGENVGLAVYIYKADQLKVADKDVADSPPIGIVVWGDGATTDVNVAIAGMVLINNSYVTGAAAGMVVYVADDGKYTTTVPTTGNVYPIGIIHKVGTPVDYIGEYTLVQVIPTAYTMEL